MQEKVKEDLEEAVRKARCASRDALLEFLEKSIGAVLIVSWTKETWSKFIALSLNAGIHRELLVEELSVRDHDLECWLAGLVVPSDTKCQAAISYILKALTAPETLAA